MGWLALVLAGPRYTMSRLAQASNNILTDSHGTKLGFSVFICFGYVHFTAEPGVILAPELTRSAGAVMTGLSEPLGPVKLEAAGFLPLPGISIHTKC